MHLCAAGVVQENIATVRDTSTLIGLLIFIVVGGAVYMADRAAVRPGFARLFMRGLLCAAVAVLAPCL